MSEATRCHAGSAVDPAPRERNAVVMRQLVMQMMTTLNGRLDPPEEWVPEIPGDLYAEIDRIYERFDTVLVGPTTALEMAGYWPGAETDERPHAAWPAR